MRTGYLVALLSTTAIFLSGCSSVDKIETAATAAATGTATTGTTGSGATGSTTGTSTGQSNTAGSTSFSFNDSSFSIAGNGRTDVSLTNAGGGIGVETASVSVNTGFAGMTWADPIEMALFTTTVLAFRPNGLHLGPNFAGYREYRRITSTTDAELQIWDYQFSRIGQYTVYFDPSAGNNNNVSLFHDGDLTPTSGLPAGAATYNGKFGGTAVAANFIERDRAVNDPFVADPAELAGQTWDPNGTWRVAGDVQVNVNFGSGAVTGVINNTTWTRFDASKGYVLTIDPTEASRPYHDYTLSGTITDNTFSGNTNGPNSVVTGNNALNGAFYGPNAEEVAGVVSSETTLVAPNDGQTPYDTNGRATITIRGVFQGAR